MLRCAQISDFCKPLEFVTRPIPEVPPKGALLKTLYAGVCHSDLHAKDGEFGPLFKTVVLGHESVGRIEVLGSEVKDSDLAVGDEVMIYPWIGCGRDDCKICINEIYQFCDLSSPETRGEIGFCKGFVGSYSTHQVVPEVKFLVKLAPDIPKEIGCMLPCSGLTAYGALKRVKVAIEYGTKIHGKATLLLNGLGGLGLWAVKFAKIMYPDIHLVGCDISENKFDLVKSEGVDSTVLLDRNGDPKEMAAKITENFTQKIHAAIDFVGSPKTQTTIAYSMHRQGTIANVGLSPGSINIPTLLLTVTGITLIGNKVGSLEDMKEAAALVAKHQIKYPYISTHSFDEVNTLLDRLKEGQIKGRAVIKHD